MLLGKYEEDGDKGDGAAVARASPPAAGGRSMDGGTGGGRWGVCSAVRLLLKNVGRGGSRVAS